MKQRPPIGTRVRTRLHKRIWRVGVTVRLYSSVPDDSAWVRWETIEHTDYCLSGETVYEQDVQTQLVALELLHHNDPISRLGELVR